MKIRVEFSYRENYLPTKRSRNERSHEVQGNADISVREVNEQDFPVAFAVEEFSSVVEGVKDYHDFQDSESRYIPFREEIRTADGKLYKPVRITHGSAVSTIFANPETYLTNQFKRTANFKLYASYRTGQWSEDEHLMSKAVVTSDTKEETIREMQQEADGYVVFGGVLWKECKEPVYLIQTFGLGGRGSVGFFVDYASAEYADNNCNVFNALERDKAVKACIEKAETWQDEEMTHRDSYGTKNIEVFMPEMVKIRNIEDKEIRV